MPVIVVGADTQLGASVLAALAGRQGEVRAFVTDPAAAAPFRSQGVRVAIGDVSDGSHVSGAALGAFGAVLMAEAASDGRERSFLESERTVLDCWDEALVEAGVTRAIWVGGAPERPSSPEVAVVETRGRPAEEIAAEVAHLDDRAEI